MGEENANKQVQNDNKNSNITAKLLLPLIGPEPKNPKNFMENEEHSFRVKLNKVKRFKNRSENYECRNSLFSNGKIYFSSKILI